MTGETENGKNSLEFRVPPPLKAEVEDLAWENRMTKSELLRAYTRYCVGRTDEILSEADIKSEEDTDTADAPNANATTYSGGD